MKPSVLLFALGLAASLASPLFAAPPAKLELQPGERVAIVGSGLADRMLHDGSLEAFIHKALPQHDISV
ncbi:MAG: hypothetical protein RLZZ09_1994, partial [Pseudomonadota bacterium]